MNNVMVDLETLGKGSNAAIVAIGAVEFDPVEGLGREFYKVVNAESSVKAGMVIDADTVKWWMQQSDEARDIFHYDGCSLDDVLRQFEVWFPFDAELWGNGATFDNVVLGNAYALCGIARPWSYRGDRCYRTLKNLYPLEMEWEGTHHNALDDAKNQARHAIAILRKHKEVNHGR